MAERLDTYCRHCGQTLLAAHTLLGICAGCIVTASAAPADVPTPGYRWQQTQDPEEEPQPWPKHPAV